MAQEELSVGARLLRGRQKKRQKQQKTLRCSACHQFFVKKGARKCDKCERMANKEDDFYHSEEDKPSEESSSAELSTFPNFGYCCESLTFDSCCEESKFNTEIHENSHETSILTPLPMLQSAKPEMNKNTNQPSLEGRPTCSDFGPLRKVQYPGYFFCYNCELWDNECKLSNRTSRTSQTFACRANYTSWDFPTDRLVESEPGEEATAFMDNDDDSIMEVEEDSEIECVNEVSFKEYVSNNRDDKPASVFITGDTNYAATPTTKEMDVVASVLPDNNSASLHERLLKLHRQLNAAQQSAVYWKRKYFSIAHDMFEVDATKETKARLVSSVDAILSAVQREYNLCDTAQSKQQLLNELATTFINVNNNNDTNKQVAVWLERLQQTMLEKARKWFRENLFPPQNILKAMDMNGGQLSLEGIEVLRRIETGNKRYIRNTILPSSAEIRRAAAVVELYAKHVVPYKHGYLESGGEFIEFEYKPLLGAILKGHGLDEVAKERPVFINQAMDGAKIDKRVTHITYGVKVVDKAAVSPFTKGPILVQSCNACFPVKIALHRETKDIYPVFQPLFEQFSSFSCPGSDVCDGIMPFKSATNCDMSTTWKGLGVGGAAKRNNMPCHCCAVESEHLATPNSTRCMRFCQVLHHDKPQWECYHHLFLSEENIARLLDEMDDIASSIPMPMDRLVKVSLMKSNEDPRKPDPLGDSTAKMDSIHFDLNVNGITRKRKREYAEIIDHDIQLRGLEAIGSLEERRQRLKDSMIKEWTYRQLKKAADHANKGKNEALFHLINAVPCILHMENRIGLKMITKLFTEGLKNALLRDGADSDKRRMQTFFGVIEQIVNTSVWGSPENPSQWECPRDESQKCVGTICLDNNRTRALITHLAPLIEICISDPGRKEQWMECVAHYTAAMELLRKKDDFVDNEILTFQYHADIFFQEWVNLYGLDGVTNYIHMLGSGHVSDYLYYWRNLYVHSQQGWEAFNSLLKTYFFRRTGRGGAGNRGLSTKSKLIPIARWLSRRLVWMCETPYEEMKAYAKEMEDSYTNDLSHE